MTSIIDTLLEKRQAEINQANDKKIRARKENKSILTASLQEAFGDFWPIIQEHGVADWSFDSSNIPSVEIEIPVLDQHRLAPINIRCRGTKFISNTYNPPFRSFGSSFNNLVEVLAHARERYLDYKERIKEKLITDTKSDLWQTNRDEGKALEAHRLLVEIAPDKKEEWDRLLVDWKSYRERMKIQLEESKTDAENRQADFERTQAAENEYTQAYIEWLRDRDLIIAANEVLAGPIRERFSHQVYNEYKLIYGAVALDEETGDKFLEQLSVYTLQDAPDETDRWIVNGKPRLFYHPISLETNATTPQNGYLTRHIKRGGVEIMFSPTMSDEDIERAVSHLIEIPPAPKYIGDVLSDYQILHECIPSARRLYYDENRQENQ